MKDRPRSRALRPHRARLSGLTSVVLLLALHARADTVANGSASSADSPLSGLAAILNGSWRCSGHFANGKKITSTEWFASLFSGRWLTQEHVDDLPFTYQAHSVWGWNGGLHVLTLTIYDNFGGSRLFTSSGWQDSALVFDERPLVGVAARQERFIYKLLPARGYSVEYQVLDESHAWKMADLLTCTRSPAAAVEEERTSH
jgi:hypothetical protein